MMRAVRFAARFGFEIEPETFRAIRRHVGEIRQVSPERLREELTKMLTEGAARQAFELLDETWLLQQVLPEIGAMKGVEQPPQFTPRETCGFTRAMMLEGLSADAPPTLAWGVLLHDGRQATDIPIRGGNRGPHSFQHHVQVGVRMAEAICKRLRFSNEDTEQILALVDNHMKFGAVEEMRASRLKKFVRLPHFGRTPGAAQARLSFQPPEFGLLRFRPAVSGSDPSRASPAGPSVSGNDLQEMGFRPGPLFSQILQAIERRPTGGADPDA